MDSGPPALTVRPPSQQGPREKLTKARVWMADGLLSIPVEHVLAQLTLDPVGVVDAVLAFPVPQGGVINT